jgi:signal transduction histidine kinase
MITLTLVAALFSLALTMAALWANPRRFSNQAFAVVSLLQTAWLACIYRAKQTGVTQIEDGGLQLESWLRANAAVIAFLPPAIWLLKTAIVCHDKWRAIQTVTPIVVLSIISAFVCYSDWFIFRDHVGLLQRGAGYYTYSLLAVSAYGICVFKIWRQMDVHSGIRRVELQFLALNFGGSALLIAAVNALGNYFQLQALKSASVFLVLATSGLTAWALLFHRVFNAQEALSQLGRRLSFALALTCGIYALWRATHAIIAEPFGLLISIGVCSPVAVWLDRKSRAWFDIGGERKLALIRRRAIDLARTELHSDNLVKHFEELLCTEFQTSSAALLFENEDSFDSPGRLLAKTRPGYRTLCNLGWATPESLLRRRANPGLDDLQRFLVENDFGVIVPLPCNSPHPSLLIALRTRSDGWPFTYPEVERLQNLGLLIDNLLVRSRLIAQAALQARMEHLAMMSRGLAHDLKNLVTPVSSFLVHTEGQFSAGSPEADVHAAARRSVRIMNDYLREALFFSERLQPCFETYAVEKICDQANAAISMRALRRTIVVSIQTNCSEPIMADGVLVQRMLANLLSNAIDASAPGKTVLLTANSHRDGWIQFQISDHGGGIAPEHLARIFEPYFTTKEFGDDTRGFGLGLTICQKIVLLHRGAISVKSELGCGTTFIVDLPTRQEAPSPTISSSAPTDSVELVR